MTVRQTGLCMPNMHRFALVVPFVFAAILVSAPAQSPPAPAGPKNLVKYGGFETGIRSPNLWTGVEPTGELAGSSGPGDGLPVLGASGSIRPTPMPLSVAVADMNGDGLPDIAVMDPYGYLRIYFNSGTKTEPKFTWGELASLFLSRVDPKDPSLQGIVSGHVRQGQRICLSDITHSGKKDLVIGNYLGEIMIIPNGSAVRPDFSQPESIAQVLIPTMKNSLDKWGNVFAPATWDWNHDGRDDLLVGEGSYSANSIHLLVNQGAGSKPVFDENNRSVLAYGMGLEQLSPCVVDYDGNGVMDLLVTERSGKVAVYLNDGKPWKPGTTLPFYSFIPIGGVKPAGEAGTSKDPLEAAKASGLLSAGGIATIAAADLNGDGLFDLVFGKSNGRVAVSFNTGTKTEPKFAAPIDIKGKPPATFTIPNGWDIDDGFTRGNFYGFASIVKAEDDPDAQPPEGKSCLKAGYFPSPNKIMAVPSQYTEAFEGWKPGTENTQTVIVGAPASYFRVSTSQIGPLKNNRTYSFSMKVKGSKVTDASARLWVRAGKEMSAAKMERHDRGAVTVKTNIAREEKAELFRFSPSPLWSEVKGEFKVMLKNKDLAAAALDGKDGRIEAGFAIVFNLAPGSGALYIDDVKLVEK